MLTTAKAAELCGMTPAVFRAHMTRLRANGKDLRLPAADWPDKRTPTYDPAAVKAWAESRQR